MNYKLKSNLKKLLLLFHLFFFFACRSQTQYIGSKEKWYELLPHCPCESPDLHGVKIDDGWARERYRSEMGFFQHTFAGKRDFTFFHPGAVTSYRSYPYVKTIIDGKKFKSGQQCAYDKEGKLIKTGPPAGTPDKSSPAKGESKKGLLKVNIFRVRKHIKFDSSPWKPDEWKEYHKYWPPDKGINCD